MPLFGLLKNICTTGISVQDVQDSLVGVGPLVIGIPSYTAAPATQQWFTPKSHVGDLAVPSKNGGIAMGLDLSFYPFCLLHVAQQSRGFRVSNFLWKNWRRNPRHCCHQQCKEDVRLAGPKRGCKKEKSQATLRPVLNHILGVHFLKLKSCP